MKTSLKPQAADCMHPNNFNNKVNFTLAQSQIKLMFFGHKQDEMISSVAHNLEVKSIAAGPSFFMNCLGESETAVKK